MTSPRHSLAAAALLGALTAGAGGAHADEYLENPNGRDGFMIGLAVGGAMYAGIGDYSEALNRGASVSLRFGASAGPRLLWMFQLDNLTYLFKEPLMGDILTHTLVIFTVAGQYYVGDALWIKAGAGPASISRTDPEGGKERSLDTGVGLMGSIGGDLKRWRSVVLGLEGVFASGIFGMDVLSYGGVRLSISHY